MRRVHKRTLWVVGVLLLYGLSYVALSASGDYRVDMTGKRRYFGGLAMMDCWHWQPKACYMRQYLGPGGEKTTDFGGLGLLYAPLIMLDRAWVHPSQYLFEVDEAEDS